MKKLLLLSAALQMGVLVAGEVKIKDLDKVTLVKVLYERANNRWAYPAQLSDAQAESASRGYINHLNGHVMNINVSGNWLDTWLYNQYHGANAAEAVIEQLHNENR